MIKDYRYDLIAADRFSGVKVHPQIDMEDNFGFHIIDWHPAPIADCVIVRIDNAETVKDLPIHIVELDHYFSGFQDIEGEE